MRSVVCEPRHGGNPRSMSSDFTSSFINDPLAVQVSTCDCLRGPALLTHVPTLCYSSKLPTVAKSCAHPWTTLRETLNIRARATNCSPPTWLPLLCPASSQKSGLEESVFQAHWRHASFFSHLQHGATQMSPSPRRSLRCVTFESTPSKDLIDRKTTPTHGADTSFVLRCISIPTVVLLPIPSLPRAPAPA